MMEKVGMRAADLGRHRLQRDGLRSSFKKDQPRCLERGGPALFGVEAFSTY
jgi:hypothetical protein